MKKLISIVALLAALVWGAPASAQSVDVFSGSGGAGPNTITVNPGATGAIQAGVDRLAPAVVSIGGAPAPTTPIELGNDAIAQRFTTANTGTQCFEMVAARVQRTGNPDGALNITIETAPDATTRGTAVSGCSASIPTQEPPDTAQGGYDDPAAPFTGTCCLNGNTDYWVVFDGDATYDASDAAGTKSVSVVRITSGDIAPCGTWTYSTADPTTTGTCDRAVDTGGGGTWTVTNTQDIFFALFTPQSLVLTPGTYEPEYVKIYNRGDVTILGGGAANLTPLAGAAQPFALDVRRAWRLGIDGVRFYTTLQETVDASVGITEPLMLYFNHIYNLSFTNNVLNVYSGVYNYGAFKTWVANNRCYFTQMCWNHELNSGAVLVDIGNVGFGRGNAVTATLDSYATSGGGIAYAQVRGANANGDGTSVAFVNLVLDISATYTGADIAGLGFGVTLSGLAVVKDSQITINGSTDGVMAGIGNYRGNNADDKLRVANTVISVTNTAGSATATAAMTNLHGSMDWEVIGGRMTVPSGPTPMSIYSGAADVVTVRGTALDATKFAGVGTVDTDFCKQVLLSSVNPTEAGATVDYLSLLDHAGSTTEANEDDFVIAGSNMIVGELSCVTATAPGAGNDDWTMTVRTGAEGALADTSVTCSIDETATTCTSGGGLWAAVTAGQALTISIDSSGADADPTASASMRCTVCLGQDMP